MFARMYLKNFALDLHTTSVGTTLWNEMIGLDVEDKVRIAPNYQFWSANKLALFSRLRGTAADMFGVVVQQNCQLVEQSPTTRILMTAHNMVTPLNRSAFRKSPSSPF